MRRMKEVSVEIKIVKRKKKKERKDEKKKESVEI